MTKVTITQPDGIRVRQLNKGELQALNRQLMIAGFSFNERPAGDMVRVVAFKLGDPYEYEWAEPVTVPDPTLEEAAKGGKS